MFNIEELSLIKMYSGINPSRDSVVAAMRDSLPYVEEEAIRAAMTNTIRKVNAMTNEAFLALDLSDTFERTGL